MAQLRHRYDEIRASGADLVAVGTGDRRYAAAFVEDEAVPFPVLVDDTGEAAAAASVETVSWWRLLHPSTWAATRETWRRGHRVHRVGPRVAQLGATFVVGPGERLRFVHRDRDSTDHAPIEAVLTALG